MLNPYVFSRDITIYAKIFIPYDTFERVISKKLLRLGNFFKSQRKIETFLKRSRNEINA